MGTLMVEGAITPLTEENLLQAETDHRPFVDGVTELLFTPPTPEQEACHEPKPILINCGSVMLLFWTCQGVGTCLGHVMGNARLL